MTTISLILLGIGAGTNNGPTLDPNALARAVTITRDDWGVPHIAAPTDDAVFFGHAYAQCEDNFWQIEDNFILALGRYAEAHGRSGVNSDLLNRAFEVTRTSEKDYHSLDAANQRMCVAFVAGLNYYLAQHPEVKPMLLPRFEPWYLLAFSRHAMIELAYRRTNLTKRMPRMYEEIWTLGGSNGFAIAPKKTKNGHALLMINPHQPWFGFGVLYEAHLQSGEGLNFTGATFMGTPVLFLGHNEHLGWALTTNQPDIADAWRETFDHPSDPLAYRYAGGYRKAEKWTETIRVRAGAGLSDRQVNFLKTHHGPIVKEEDAQHRLAVQIARLRDAFPSRQLLAQMKAKNFDEFRAAMRMVEFQYQNHMFADQAGNIFFISNGSVPKRDPSFDWEKPLDGSDPRTEWAGIHPMEDLPQVTNPPSGYVQNCNSSAFTVTDDGGPFLLDYPPYLAGTDAHVDNRRAKVSRHLLRQANDLTFESMQRLAMDTTCYWAYSEIPKYLRDFAELESRDRTLAERVRPYLEHLRGWDYRVTLDSTAATLCHAWYEELYGNGSPAEKLLPKYVAERNQRFAALARAADTLKQNYGSWQVRWGEVYRIQRHDHVTDFISIPFSDKKPSLPCACVPGPMGVVSTLHYMPRVSLPGIRTAVKRYGIVGNSYMSVVELAPRIRAVSLIQFGQSADPKSRHYLDQAALLSAGKFKPAYFYPDEIAAHTARRYHPGDESKSAGP